MPRLIVLDEPNANLDQAGESSLAEALKDLKQRGCTIIVVGHRPSTLSQADKLLVLQDGYVTMFGDRDDVMQAWSEASAGNDAADALPVRRSSSPQSASKALERLFETGGV
jgi:ATP-binding cassette subfamily C protein/ATP-binding cassette subfamily C exporter for protease/lipase/ATP-binding cassette subfamily C protein EexD